jgi:hypothetical protein
VRPARAGGNPSGTPAADPLERAFVLTPPNVGVRDRMFAPAVGSREVETASHPGGHSTVGSACVVPASSLGYFVLNEGSSVMVWLPLSSRASTSPPVLAPGLRNSAGMVTLVTLGGRYMLNSRPPWFTITW